MLGDSKELERWPCGVAQPREGMTGEHSSCLLVPAGRREAMIFTEVIN